MEFDNGLVAAKLRRWERYLEQYRLPSWDEIPDLGLYMEQVISFLRGTLDYLPPELQEEQSITAAAINNYVRTRVMPKPLRKRYYRVHIAYLLVICSLKQSLSLSLIGKIIPFGIPEEEVRVIYDNYVAQHSAAAVYFIRQVSLAAGPILEHRELGELSTERTEDLIASSAILGGFCHLFAEKLLLLDGKTLPPPPDTG